MTKSSPDRPRSLWRRLHGYISSSSATRTRLAASDVPCEHIAQPSQRQLFAATFCGSSRVGAGQPRAATVAGGRAQHQVEPGGRRPHAHAHLQALRALLVLPAAGACRKRSSDRRHSVHHDTAVQVLFLEQHDEPKLRLPAPRRAAHARMRRWARPEPWDGLRRRARPHSGVPHSIATGCQRRRRTRRRTGRRDCRSRLGA